MAVSGFLGLYKVEEGDPVKKFTYLYIYIIIEQHTAAAAAVAAAASRPAWSAAASPAGPTRHRPGQRRGKERFRTSSGSPGIWPGI